MNNIIKNKVILKGDDDTIRSIIKMLIGKENIIDFNKIKPMAKRDDDLVLNDYMNFCLNVYLQYNQDDREELISTLIFVGRTREVPYDFYMLSEDKLNNIKDITTINEIIKEANKFIDKVKCKAIFNGYIIIDSIWGTGSGATNCKINKNVLEFTTYDKAPMLVFEELSRLYPNIEINYLYKVGSLEKIKTIKNGKITNIDRNPEYNEPLLFNLINENVLI